MCGLKHGVSEKDTIPNESHPSWVCGLKRDIAAGKYTLKQVTPFVGVWIETTEVFSLHPPWLVTPFVGVWIETTLFRSVLFCAQSHTLRGCVD